MPDVDSDKSITAPNIWNCFENGRRFSSDIEMRHPSSCMTNSAVSQDEEHRASDSSWQKSSKKLVFTIMKSSDMIRRSARAILLNAMTAQTEPKGKAMDS